MDDDFLSENIFPLTNEIDDVVNISNVELNGSTTVNCRYLFPSSVDIVNGRELTLNATNEHIELTSQFYNNPQFADVILRVGLNQYYAHKFILAKSSDVLATLLYSQHWTMKNEEVVLEEEKECQGDVFEKFLKFFYTAKVILNESIVTGLLYLSDKYNVQSLKRLCIEFMMLNARSPNVNNSFVWYSIAKQFSLDDLREICMKTIAWNMESLLSDAYETHWLKFEFNFILDLLSTSDIIISSEYRLYVSISDWLLSQSSDIDIQNYACQLLPMIRFPQMLPSQLYQIEQSKLYEYDNEQVHNLFKHLLYRTYRFHTLAKLKQDSSKIEFLPLQWYLPRDYTEMNITDRVDIQSTLRFGIQVDVQTCSSPVPSIDRTADWKIVYRKRHYDNWILKIHRCDDSNDVHAQITAIIYDSQRRVVQVDKSQTFTFTNSNEYELEIVLNNPCNAKELYILIKPVIS